MQYLIAGFLVWAAVCLGGSLLFLLSFGSFINHMGQGEQDDDET